MTSLKPLPLAVPARRPRSHLARHAVAALLRAASAVLAHLAVRLSAPVVHEPVERLPAVLEFYADAGAPEGALYLDGELVGWLPGVTRL
jgi:hypothetical protein